MASWRGGTSKQYQTYLGRWQQYCTERNINVFQPGVTLSSFLVLEDGVEFGEHPLVVRCMKGMFELKPSQPKYSEIWDVNILLGYLKIVDTLSSLTLKELTLNLTMLLCLTTGQRGQTIHKFHVNYIQEMDDRYRITICEKLKQTKPGRHLAPIDLIAYQNKPLVISHTWLILPL